MVEKLSYTNYPLSSQIYDQHGGMVEEIEGLIRVFKNGHVERPLLVPNVPCTMPYELSITCKDVVIDNFTNVWARLYISITHKKLPLLVYFHGGGFCVGSASWGCYHDFLANLACKAGCVIISVNYRLAPENRLPTAYEDGVNSITWVKQHASSINGLGQCCNFSSLFLAGDSAGANIAHHVSTRVVVKGTILIQPFFGGEARTKSEKNSIQPPNSALTLSVSDTYWRLALPIGANRDHPWCNPIAKGGHKLRDLRLSHSTMVFVSEMDILKDRNLDFCSALTDAGNRVQTFIYKDVGHAFQVLHNCPMSQYRTRDMMFHLKAFINQ